MAADTPGGAAERPAAAQDEDATDEAVLKHNPDGAARLQHKPLSKARTALESMALGTVGPAEALPPEGEEEGLSDFVATAYCLQGRTASGVRTRPGVIAADPHLLPIGTIVHVRAGQYTGTYTVLDTGALIKGRKIDVYLPSYKEAICFGRRPVKLKILNRPRRARPARKSARIQVEFLE